MFGGRCLVFARISRFMKQIKAYGTTRKEHRREGSSKALHGSRLHFGSRDFIRFVFSFIVLLKNCE